MQRSLLFETHATSLDNEAGLASGWHDVDLSPLGETQAREMGERYRAELPEVVFASDLWRAWRTAEIAFGEHVPVVRDIRLREIDYGHLTRHTIAEVEARRAASVTTPYPGGESYTQVVERVRAFLEEAREDQPGNRFLVVGHRGTLYALEHLLGGRSLAEVVVAPWVWQPGWRYVF
jgi:broad specificity phosphatase PhoE